MRTRLKTIHNEEYSDGSRTLGVLLNYSANEDDWKESFIFMFRQTEEGGRYVFFETMFDLWSYILYGENKVKIAYMSEEDFDSYYDAPYIECLFSEKLKWV